MIVRLKDISLNARSAYISMFQFYDSPIKSVTRNHLVHPSIKFQFYDSPIKSIEGFIDNVIVSSFNSMIVRLKAALVRLMSKKYEGFQFYDSPIKRKKGENLPPFQAQFQFYDSPIKR